MLLKKAILAKQAEPAKDDARSLGEVKLTADDPAGLIGYLKSRTLSEADLARIRAVIERMGDESFDARLKASTEALAFGASAIGPLRSASQSHADPEISYRSLETLRAIEKNVSHAAVASAAARALAKSKHPDAVAALLGFLPMADNAAVDEDLRLAVNALALRDGKLDPAVVAALKDANGMRRGAAAVALLQVGLAEKTLNDEIVKLVVPMIKSEVDSDSKFRVAFILATRGGNADAITALVEVLPDLAAARGYIWQIEDVLLQLGGDKPPAIKLGSEKPALERGRDEWLAWIKANVKPDDFAKFQYKPRTTGRIQMLWADNNWGSGRVIEFGPDLRARWKFTGVMVPADFRVLPNGNMEVLEHNYNQLRELDMKGTQKNLRRFNDTQPMCMQRFDDGKILMAFRQNVTLYDSEWKVLKTYARANQDVLAAGRVGNGPIWVLAQGGPGVLFRLDDDFKELPNPITAGNPHYQAKMELLPNDRAIITDQSQVTEFDLKTGKSVWSFKCNTPYNTQRLPSGNTLLCDGDRSVREIAPDGEVLWKFTPPDGLQTMRAYRQ